MLMCYGDFLTSPIYDNHAFMTFTCLNNDMIQNLILYYTKYKTTTFINSNNIS